MGRRWRRRITGRRRSRRRRRRRTSVHPRVINDVGIPPPPSSLFTGLYKGSFPLREVPRWRTTVQTSGSVDFNATSQTD